MAVYLSSSSKYDNAIHTFYVNLIHGSYCKKNNNCMHGFLCILNMVHQGIIIKYTSYNIAIHLNYDIVKSITSGLRAMTVKSLLFHSYQFLYANILDHCIIISLHSNCIISEIGPENNWECAVLYQKNLETIL